MTTENIRSAAKVLSDFLDEQSKDEHLEQSSVSAIIELRSKGKLTRTNLLRQLEDARSRVLKGDIQQDKG
ncbi:hypothetical protein [Hyphomicrobium sp. 1Nfss2.1]|uniref:hypothetical protein n=1 Tax=Hyphomicrobium sp. 1Nfss2.1 TaxID=3413936 RepID=UPI003C7C94C0